MRLAEGYDDTVRMLRERFGKDVITAHELADYWGVNYRTALKYIKSKRIQAYRPGKLFLIPVTQIARSECCK